MAEPSTSGPPASKHVFLNELTKQAVGSKVRFLCCVLEYDVKLGCIEVEHGYPHNVSPIPTAIVDVNLIFEMMEKDILSHGSWINVIGIVLETPSRSRKRKKRNTQTSDGDEVLVQAVLMWDAGAIKVTEYEEIMERQRGARRLAEAETLKYT